MRFAGAPASRLLRSPRMRRRQCLLGGLGLVAAGCTQRGVLAGPGGHRRWSAADATTGLTAVLTAGVWDGKPASLTQEWTVVHLLAANLGERPVLLAPGDFELKDFRGFRYSLIDPGAAFHPIDESPRAVGSYGRQLRRDYDPGGPVEFTPLDVGGDVSARALPWGVLLPNTQIRGFLYFESMGLTANGGTLVWHAISDEHERLVDLKFDLRLSREHAVPA